MNADSSASSKDGGNTKTPSSTQISPAIRWCFTLNNWSKEELSSIISVFDTKARLYIIGDETGSCGTPHLQGYVEFKAKCRPLNLFTFKRIHWEKAKGTREENIFYCSKQKVLCSFGIPKPIQIIHNLYSWQKDIEDIILTEPDDRKVYWFWDDDGNIGKSAFIKYCCVIHRVAFCCGGKYSDIMNLIFNTDMDKVNCVMFDIPRCNNGHISYSSIESIKNGLVCNTKYETGFKVFNSPHVFVFANEPPDRNQLSADRWIVTKL